MKTSCFGSGVSGPFRIRLTFVMLHDYVMCWLALRHSGCCTCNPVMPIIAVKKLQPQPDFRPCCSILPNITGRILERAENQALSNLIFWVIRHNTQSVVELVLRCVMFCSASIHYTLQIDLTMDKRSSGPLCEQLPKSAANGLLLPGRLNKQTPSIESCKAPILLFCSISCL